MPKSELEKMLSNELYNASDSQLVDMRLKARKLFSSYNQTLENDRDTRRQILYELFGKTGKHIDIQPPFYCDYGCFIYAGENFFMNFDCCILDCNEVHIGDNFMAGPKVQIYTAYHPLKASERIKGPELAASINIGNNVWLGGGAIICPGVSIGDNTTIGAGSVVTKDIPSRVFAAGNPCKVIKEIT